MEKRTKALLSGAGVAAAGLALVLGNGLLSQAAFAEATNTAGASSQAALTETEHPTSQNGEGSVDLTVSAEPGGSSSGELGDGTLIDLVPVDGSEDQEAILTRTTVAAEGEANSVFVEGQPGEGDISKQAAIDTATDAVVQKYSLSTGTLNRFTVTARLNVVDAAHPVWQVVFDPKDFNEFSTIGSYMVSLNAKTGEPEKIRSAADGVG